MAEASNINPFASKVLIITVGPDRAQFNIHEALLQQRTSFFDIHPTQNGGTFVKDINDDSPKTVKQESPPATEPEQAPSTPVADTASTRLHPGEPTIAKQVTTSNYHLGTHFVKAFAILVDWLYNTGPATPKSLTHCKVLVQAYLLARRYAALGLQNMLLDRIRGYHVGHNVNFDLLFIYLLNRCKDDYECGLINYFIDQIAYEIADSSVDEFALQNAGFDNFLTSRPVCTVRRSLFYQLANIAKVGKVGQSIKDPAVGDARDRNYYV